MGTIARTTKAGGGTNFNSGQVIDPAEVNTDLNTVYTEINALLDDANIETATIPGAKSLRFSEITAPSSPSSNDILQFAVDFNAQTRLATKDSAGRVLYNVAVIDFNMTANSFLNSVAENTAYTYTVPAGTLVANRALRVTLAGDYLNDTAGASDLTIRVKFGATTYLANAAVSCAQDTTRRAIHVVCTIWGTGAATQMSSGNIIIGGVGSAVGSSVAPLYNGWGNRNNGAENGAIARDLVITVQHGTGDANIIFTVRSVLTELL